MPSDRASNAGNDPGGARPTAGGTRPERRVHRRFAKSDRLLKRRDFVSLSKSGKKAHSRHFLVLYRPGEKARTRLGVTVTRKVAKATGRNRIKRLVREAFRHRRPFLDGCWDINVVAKQAAADVRAFEAFQELQAVFDRIDRPYTP